MRAVGHRLLIDRRPQNLRQLRRLRQRIRHGHLVAADNHRAPGLQQSFGEPSKRFVPGPGRGVDAGRLSQLEATLSIENIPRKGDEHRTGGRRGGNLRRTAKDAGQVLDAGDFDSPLDQRIRHRHQRVVEQGLGEAVALLLLTGGEDNRRADPLGVVQRSHRVPKAGRDVNVAGGEPARGAGEAVGHGHHQRLLQAEHVLQGRAFSERRHDGKLGGPGISEQVADAFVFEQGNKRCPTRHGLHGAPPLNSVAGSNSEKFPAAGSVPAIPPGMLANFRSAVRPI